ncbi:hypothetical protein NECID01_0014 [Nematocida sp. AWRm77]|nr:hypothetical protein NECID01_0014 [Nematocida sp. AWRm77]
MARSTLHEKKGGITTKRMLVIMPFVLMVVVFLTYHAYIPAVVTGVIGMGANTISETNEAVAIKGQKKYVSRTREKLAKRKNSYNKEFKNQGTVTDRKTCQKKEGKLALQCSSRLTTSKDKDDLMLEYSSSTDNKAQLEVEC